MIGRFGSILFVSYFQASMPDAVVVVLTATEEAIISWVLSLNVGVLLKGQIIIFVILV